jgi:hypothetical protein
MPTTYRASKPPPRRTNGNIRLRLSTPGSNSSTLNGSRKGRSPRRTVWWRRGLGKSRRKVTGSESDSRSSGQVERAVVSDVRRDTCDNATATLTSRLTRLNIICAIELRFSRVTRLRQSPSLRHSKRLPAAELATATTPAALAKKKPSADKTKRS